MNERPPTSARHPLGCLGCTWEYDSTSISTAIGVFCRDGPSYGQSAASVGVVDTAASTAKSSDAILADGATNFGELSQ